MNAFNKRLIKTQDRMAATERTWAQTAKRENWQVVGVGSCYEGGPVLVRVIVPEQHRQHFANIKHDFLQSDYLQGA